MEDDAPVMSNYWDQLDRRAADPAAWLEAILGAVDMAKEAREAYGPGSPSFRKFLEFLRLANQFPPEGGPPRKPSPLAATLLGGILGAALGYGAAMPLSMLLPRNWESGRLRRSSALLGAALGASPGLFFGLTNLALGRSYDDPSALEEEGYVPKVEPSQLEGEAWKLLAENLPSDSPWPEFSKRAQGSLTGLESVDGIPWIPRYEFHNTIWRDPRVSSGLSLPERAAASGLVEAAANLPGRSAPPRFVTPLDMARVAAGMGSGYASGWLVGKALGALMGMPESAQEKLKQTGMWAGAVSNLLPAVFGK